ncbi:ATP-binding protein [Bradyrhizobium sp.]|uniref:ATP-binding protein n=1 Tax=Bradyrhizobium sp. TaxID=376 RepID=UPI003520AA5E
MLHVDVKTGIAIPPDKAIPVALFVNELIANAAKYGSPDQRSEIWIGVVGDDREISVSVRDRGVGCRPTSSPTRARDWGCVW